MAPAYHAVGSALRAVPRRGARGRGGRGSGHVGCRRPRAGGALPYIRRRPPAASRQVAPLPGHVHGRGARVAVGGSRACERTAGRLSVDQRPSRSEEHTSELQSRLHLVCRLLLEKKKGKQSLKEYYINIDSSTVY